MRPDVGHSGRTSPQALRYLIAAAVIVLPFIQSSRTIDFDLLPKFLAMAILVLITQGYYCFRRASPDRLSFRIHPVVWIPVLFGLVSLLSVLQAGNLTEAALECLKLGILIVFFFQTLFLMSEAGAVYVREIVSKAMIVFAASSGGMGLVEAALKAWDGYSLQAMYAVTGTFGHKNLFASIVSLSLPFCLYGIRRYRGRWRFASAVSLALGTVLVLALQTRSVWMGMGIAGLAASALLWADAAGSKAGGQSRWARFRKIPIVAMCAAIALFAFLRLVVPAHPGGIRDRVESSFDPGRNAWRTMLWDKSMAMFADRPWSGFGPGNWKIEFQRFQTDDLRLVGGDPDGVETEFVRPHNDFIWVLCETGIPGGILYAGFFLGLLVVGIRKRIRIGDPEARTFALCVSMSVIGYMVDSWFSFPRERIAHGAFLMILAASLLSEHGTKPGNGLSVPAFRRKIAAGSVAVLMAVAVWAGISRLRSEVAVRQALQARADGRWQDVVDWISQADDRIYPLDPVVNPIMFYRGTAYYQLGDPNKAKADFESGLLSNPFHAHSLNNLGTCMQLTGHPAQAIENFSRALRLRPGMVDPWLNGASVYYNEGEYAKAREWLAQRPPQPDDPRWKKIAEALEASE